MTSSQVNAFENLPFYVDKVDNIEALLLNEGDFVIQSVEHATNYKTKEVINGTLCALSVNTTDKNGTSKIRHWLVKQKDGKFGIEQATYDSVSEMIEDFVTSQKSILEDEVVLLKNPVVRERVCEALPTKAVSRLIKLSDEDSQKSEVVNKDVDVSEEARAKPDFTSDSTATFPDFRGFFTPSQRFSSSSLGSESINKLELRYAISKACDFREFIQLYGANNADSVSIPRIIHLAELVFKDYQQYVLETLHCGSNV
jgi:hypothetical protein